MTMENVMNACLVVAGVALTVMAVAVTALIVKLVIEDLKSK